MPSEPPDSPDSRRGALIGLVIVAILVAAAYLLVGKLRSMSAVQDCAMQGRSNCAPIE